MDFEKDIKINKILFNKYNTLGKLCSHSLKLQTLDNILKKILDHKDSALAKECRVGSMINNCLVIEVSRSEYLAQLKYNTIELLSELRKIPQFSQLVTIKYKVCPQFTITPELSTNLKNVITDETVVDNTEKNPRSSIFSKLTVEIQNSLVNTIKNISNNRLQEALIKLFEINKS